MPKRLNVKNELKFASGGKVPNPPESSAAINNRTATAASNSSNIMRASSEYSASRQAGNNNITRSTASHFDGDEGTYRCLVGSGSSSSRSTSRGKRQSPGQVRRRTDISSNEEMKDPLDKDPLVGCLIRKPPPPPPPPQPRRGRHNHTNLNPIPPPVRNRSRPAPPVKAASFSGRGRGNNQYFGEESYCDDHERINSPPQRRAPPPRTSNSSGGNQNILSGSPTLQKRQLRGSASLRSSTSKSSFGDEENSDITPPPPRRVSGGEGKSLSSLRSSSRGGEMSSRNSKSNDSLLMMSKVESALRQIKTRTPPAPNRSIARPASDVVDMLPTSPTPQKIASNPPAPKQQQSRPQVGNDWHQYLTKSKRSTSRRRRSSRSNSPEPERDTSRGRRASSTGRSRSRGRSQSAGKNQAKGSMNDDNRMLEGSSENNWMKYLTKGKRSTSRRRRSSRSNSPVSERDVSRGRQTTSTERNRSRGRSQSAKRKIFGRAPEKLDSNDRQVNNVVTNMPFTDAFGDAGIYTGQVNDDGRPDDKGSMKYDNGIFYEGSWTDGSQDEKAVTQYERIRGGFTSWGGKGKVAVKSGRTMPWNAHKNDKHDENDKTNVRGMEWVDLNGDSGRYTGEVDTDNVPHGKGKMKFDFGLIAEGEWAHGVLKENPQDRALSAAELRARGQGVDAVSVMSSVRSLGRGGGVSIGTGVSGSSDSSMMRSQIIAVAGPGMPVAQGAVYSSNPQTQMMIQPQQVMMVPSQMMIQPQLSQQMMMQPQLSQPMMMPQPNDMASQSQQDAALVAQQNAMQTMAMYGGGYPQMAQIPMQQQQISMQEDPPISEIKFS